MMAKLYPEKELGCLEAREISEAMLTNELVMKMFKIEKDKKAIKKVLNVLGINQRKFVRIIYRKAITEVRKSRYGKVL